MILEPVLNGVLQPILRTPFDATGGGFDAAATAWAAAVTANGGTYSGTTLAAVSAFAVSAKASGYWTKLNRINLFCGDQLAAALVPLKAGGGSATETNVNFVSGDYTEVTGLTGNGTTKYLNTGLVPSVSLTLNDTHLAVYNRSASAASTFFMGAGDGSGTVTGALPNSDGLLYSDQYNAAAGRVTSGVGIATPCGMLVASRTAAVSHAVYRNGASLNSNATSGGALPAVAAFVFAWNSSGAPTSFSTHPIAAYSMGSGLSAGDVTAYNTHMQTFQTSLLRNV